MRLFALLCSCVVAGLLAGGRCPAAPCPQVPRNDTRVTVTVVVVLATTKDKNVDPRLACIAREIQKRDERLKQPEKLTGFRMGPTTSKSLPLGGSETFPLVDKKEATIEVNRCTEKPERFCLKIKSPGLVGEIVYSCVCGKYFPLDTGCVTKKGQDRVILAIMVEPCPRK